MDVTSCAYRNDLQKKCTLDVSERNKNICNTCNFRLDNPFLPQAPSVPQQTPPSPIQGFPTPSAPPPRQQTPAAPKQPAPPQTPPTANSQGCLFCFQKDEIIARLTSEIEKLKNKLRRFSDNQKGRQISSKIKKLLTERNRNTIVFLRSKKYSYNSIAAFFNGAKKDKKDLVTGKTIERILSGYYDGKVDEVSKS